MINGERREKNTTGRILEVRKKGAGGGGGGKREDCPSRLMVIRGVRRRRRKEKEWRGKLDSKVSEGRKEGI